MKKENLILSIICLSLLLSFRAFAQSALIDADIVVALDGSGDFIKIQDAIDVVEDNSDRKTTIYIKRGNYSSEKLIIPSSKKNVCFIGESRDETIISYHIYDCANGKCPTEDASLWSGDNIKTSATLTIQGDGFRAENLTIENTAGPVGQAQAITVQADKVVFVNCNLTGYQDTIYFWSDGKRAYLKNCLIVGRTDYIYGGGIAFFQSCEIRSWGGGWITAPSTSKDLDWGFVFYQCDITYAENSPRPGDDGALVRFGRPWHYYPKVAWLYCNMTEMIHPEGWGDTWNMEYAATSSDLHLYEYANTGLGADMGGRADWTGLRKLTENESLQYSVENVLAGDDNWNPTAESPLTTTHNWTGNGTTTNWLEAANWDSGSTPSTGESAIIDGDFTVDADGGEFPADLSLRNSAKLNIKSNSNATYVAAYGTEFQSSADVIFEGKISTKDSLVFNVSGNLTLNAQLTGIHKLIKKSSGKLILNNANTSYSGNIQINSGELVGEVANSLGKGNVTVASGATLTIGNSNAFQPTSKLKIETGSVLVLRADITTSEFFIDEVIQETGVYSSASHPELIQGVGELIIGRPSLFTFIGGENGDWDNPTHFIPGLMPKAGETVQCAVEMETTSTIFEADIHLLQPGNLRLRGDHTSTGTISMEAGTDIKYNTGGAGFSLNAPLALAGDVKLIMESGSDDGSSMKLGGPISGTNTITVINNGKGIINKGTVILQGDNSNFSGKWDLTASSEKYPSDNYISVIQGQSANAFGTGIIAVGSNNKVIFNHPEAISDEVILEMSNSAKAVLNVDIQVETLNINDQDFGPGTYTAATNPEYFEGTGSITVSWPVNSPTIKQCDLIELHRNTVLVHGKNSELTIYTMWGAPLAKYQNEPVIALDYLKPGIYIIAFEIDNHADAIKVSIL